MRKLKPKKEFVEDKYGNVSMSYDESFAVHFKGGSTWEMSKSKDSSIWDSNSTDEEPTTQAKIALVGKSIIWRKSPQLTVEEIKEWLGNENGYCDYKSPEHGFVVFDDGGNPMSPAQFPVTSGYYYVKFLNEKGEVQQDADYTRATKEPKEARTDDSWGELG